MTQPNKKKNAVIGIVLSIWGCIWLLWISAVTLLSSNVVSSQWGWVTMTYSWFEDKTEAVNELQFVQSWLQTDAWIVSQMYAWDDTTLVVTTNPLVSIPAEWWQDNQLVGDADSQIIWWAWVQVWSDNITIIWWSNNQISWWNDSATVLWWTWNKLWNAWWSTPSVLVGGAGNEISDSEWWVIIWWSWNKIIWGSNSQILWWERNEVNVDNALVAWSWVQNTWAWNSFVFSDWSTRFSPATSWAFYISTEMWLWLNAESSSWSLASAWWISVWYIDIVNNSCNTSNVWVQWLYAWCLVWCTTWSALSGKWDLLEISNECITWCDSSSLCRDTIKKADYESYPWWCNVDSLWDLAGTAEPCDLDIDPDKYKDVVFDVDFVNECPNWDLTVLANPCVYKCPAWLVAEGGDCKAGCEFGSETLLHGEVRKGYAATWIVCWPDWKTCADYEVIVKCTNGHISYAQKPGAPIIVTTPSGIKWDTCSLSGTLCPSQYNLTSTGIVGWIFSWCTEYTSVWNTQCNTTTKYQLIGCESGYVKKEGEDVCLIGCKLPWSSTWLTVPYGTVVTWFENASIPCDTFGEATSCDRLSDTLQCWENWAWIGYPRIYSNPSCEVTAINPFTDYYNLSECPKARAASGTVVAGVIPEGTSIWYCEINTGYTVSWGQVCQIYYAYHLTWCIEWYSKSWDSCLPRCILPWSNDWLHYNTGGTDTWVNAAKWASGSIIYGQPIKWYKTISQQCPVPLATWSSNHLKWCEATDNWMTMTCGTWWVLPWKDTYKYKGCETKPVAYPPEYNRTEEVENANCESFQPYSTWDNICNEDHLRWKCTSCKTWYTLNWDISKLVWWDTTVQCLADCTFDISPSGTYTLSWFSWSRLFYKPYGYTCPDKYSEWEALFTCYNWKLTSNNSNVATWSKPYTWYNQTALRPSQLIVDDWTQTGVRTIVMNGDKGHGISNTVNVDVSSRISISPYTTYFPYYLTWNGKICDLDKTYYYLKCKPDTNTTDRDEDNSYVWPTSTSNNTCIRCNWTVPENAHRNNATFPTSSSVDFHYSTNSSEICGFSCDDWYYWSGGACLSYYCDLNNGSIKVLHNTIRWSSKPIYKPSTNPICDTECEPIPAKCLYWEWRKLNGSTVTSEVITDAFDTCATRNWYVITYPTRQSPVAGTYSPSLGTYEKLLSTIPTNTQLKQQATNYIANGESCSEGDTKYKVECPQANYYWSGELCLKRCVSLTWAKYTQWQTISTYASSDPTCPTECSTVTAKCKSDWTWDRTLYGTCSTKTWSACTSDFNLTTQSDSNWLYAECSAANWTTCSSRYRLTWCVAWYTLYNGWCYKNCTLDGKTINYNTTGIWYSTNKTCADVATCASKKMVLKCTWTNKTSTYLVKDWTSTTESTGFSGCIETCSWCTWTPWGNLSHKQIVTWAKASSLSCTSSSVKCEYGNIQCWNGSLSGNTSTYSETSCWLSTVDNCPAGTSMTKRVIDTTFSDSNASLTNTCYAYIADNTNNKCTTRTYRYYECDSGYSWDAWMNACVADLGCGSAVNRACYSSVPSSSDLCSNSTASEFQTGSTEYSRKCSKDWDYTNCSVDRCAVCWNANGKTVSSAPSSASDLCSVWTKSAWVTTNTNTYSWTCKNGTSTGSCSAYRYAVCWNAAWDTRSSAPSSASDLCSVWTKSAWVTGNTNTYDWICKNGTSTDSCSTYRYAACWNADWWCRSSDSAPSSASDLCLRWTKSAWVTTNTNTYSWTCKNGTNSTGCSADRPAVCWNANWRVQDEKPTSASDLCSRGTASTPTSSNWVWTWTCTNWSCPRTCSTSAPWACTTTDGYNVAHGVTDTYYTKTPVTCTSSTEKCSNYTKSLTCDNWSFYDWSTKWTNAVYKYCSTSNGSCSISDYNLTSSDGLSNCNLSSPVYCYVKNGDTACKQSSNTPRWKILSAKAGYYINDDKTDCLPNCPSGEVDSPYCNDGSTPTNKDGITYKYSYSYKCGITCNVHCEPGQVWDGTKCFTISAPCVNKSTDASSSDAYKCQKSFSGNINNLDKGYFWDCKDGDNNVVGSCHACKAGYTWSVSANDCVMDTRSCGWSKPTSHVAASWASTYTYTWTIRSWTKITSWTPWACQYKCETYYNSGAYCAAEVLNCSGSKPSSNNTAWPSTYTYSWTIRSWTKIDSWTPWACQYKCNSGYNKNSNCDKETTIANGFANIKNNSTDCSLSGMKAIVNGVYYSIGCIVQPGHSDACSVGGSFEPGNNYSISIVTDDGTCSLEAGWSTSVIDSLWWLWWKANGPSNYNGYYWNCTCKAPDACADYPLSSCPNHWDCSQCPSNANKWRLNSCQPTACTQYCANCPSNDRLWACPPNASCQTCTTYYKNWNTCKENTKSYRFLNCIDGYVLSGTNNCVLSSTDWVCGTGQYQCLRWSAINKHEYTWQYVWTWNCSGTGWGSNSPQCTYSVKFNWTCNTSVKFVCNWPMSATNTWYDCSTKKYTRKCPWINWWTTASCELYDANGASCSWWGGWWNSSPFCHTRNGSWVPFCATAYASYPWDTPWLLAYCKTVSESNCANVGVLYTNDTTLWTWVTAVTLPYTTQNWIGHTETTYQCCEFW